MEIRFLSSKDSLPDISNIYESSWKYAYKGIIPQAYLDDLESLSNGGASAETMGQTLYKWFMAKKLSRDQLNWLLNSYGSGDFAVRMGDVIRDLLAENGG